MKIFWSWQSDTDGRIGRFLVRDALRDAVGGLKESLEIDEPVRDALHIDHDIQGVSGSPDLVPTILAKIDSLRSSLPTLRSLAKLWFQPLFTRD